MITGNRELMFWLHIPESLISHMPCNNELNQTLCKTSLPVDSLSLYCTFDLLFDCTMYAIFNPGPTLRLAQLNCSIRASNFGLVNLMKFTEQSNSDEGYQTIEAFFGSLDRKYR
jgi:hypothetical protein